MTEPAPNANSQTTPPPSAQTTQTTPPSATPQSSQQTSTPPNNTPAPTDTQTKTPQEQSLLDDKSNQPAPRAPEKYEDFKLPDGFTLTDEGKTELQTIARDLDLDQAGAQKLADAYAKKITEAQQAPFEVYNEMRDNWKKEVFTDKTLGNGKDGFKPEVQSAFKNAIDFLGDDAAPFRKALALTGAGDNPAFLRGFYKFAQSFAEGKPTQAGGPSAKGQVDPSKGAQGPSAAALYPNLPSSTG